MYHFVLCVSCTMCVSLFVYNTVYVSLCMYHWYYSIYVSLCVSICITACVPLHYRYHRSITVSELYRMRDTLDVLDQGGVTAGRVVVLTPTLHQNPPAQPSDPEKVGAAYLFMPPGNVIAICNSTYWVYHV